LRIKALPLLLIIVVAAVIPATSAAETYRYRYVMSYVFENRGSTPFTLDQDDASVPLFVNNWHQTVTVMSSDPVLGDIYVDDDGNSLRKCGIPLTINPGQKLSYAVTYEISSSDDPGISINMNDAGGVSEIPSSLVTQYVFPTETFMSNSTEVMNKAQLLTENRTTVLGQVMAMLFWLKMNVTYDNIDVPRYPNETLKGLKGDCDDQAILLISMCRSLGIPAYLQVGIVLSDGIDVSEKSWDDHLIIEEKGIGWHGWAMVYIPPWGWLPVDLTLTSTSNPLEVIQNSPERSHMVVTCLDISKQAYIGDSRVTREKITASGLYVTSKDEAMVIEEETWADYTMIALGVVLAASVIVMFWAARRRSPGRREQVLSQPRTDTLSD
jgi:transglutaminase-like putative cysteine protease